MYKLIQTTFAIFGLTFFFYVAAPSQKIGSQAIGPNRTTPQVFAGSPAFAEVLLRKTEFTAELESLLPDYTDEYPKVKELRFALGALQTEIDRLSKIDQANAGRLTLALGRLIVRKVELETDVWNLLRTYKDEHPDVKRAKRKVDIYEAAIKEILG